MNRALALVPLALVAVAVSLPPRFAGAQDGDAHGDGPVFVGAGSCSAHACHGGGGEEMWRGSYSVWMASGAHKDAFDVLSNETGKTIGKRLGIDPTTSAQCLNCHGVDLEKHAVSESFDKEEGFSCELCHGAAADWLGEHTKPGWTDLPAAEKAQHGFRDLSTAESRAANCVECHVGGPGRDITHDIMAAGHPPLQFDLVRYQHMMTPHWEPDKTLEGPAAWLTGAQAVAHAQLAHAARLADAANAGAPDFAAFDCWSCHHPIGTGSVYERHGPAGGRPGDLPLELSGLAVFAAAAGADGPPAPAPFPARGGADEARRMAEQARAAAHALADARGAADPGAARGNLTRRLDRIAAGDVRAPRAELNLLAMAAWSLAKDRDGDAFKTAENDAQAVLDPTRPYDERNAARIVKRLLEAGGG